MEDLIQKLDAALQASPGGVLYNDFHATLDMRERALLRNVFKLAEQRGIAYKRIIRVDGKPVHMIVRSV